MAYDSLKGLRDEKQRCTALLLLLFLTGLLLGCLFVRHFDLSASLLGTGAAENSGDAQRFWAVLLRNGKFLLVIYLLAFSRSGALLIPLIFALEGLMLGTAAGGVLTGQGALGLVGLGLLFLFRLTLVIPFGFLLGCWAVERSLSFGTRPRESGGILLTTLLVLLLSALLECTLARWLGGIYFLKFGV